MIFKIFNIKRFIWIFIAYYLCTCQEVGAQVLKVACIGNSVTYGAGLPDPSKQSYPAQLQQLLGSAYQVGNFGYSGATLLKNGHNPYYKTKAFTDALAFKPDIAIIHLGLNDTDPRNWPNYRGQFERDYHWLLDTLQQVNPAVKLYVCMLTPIFSGHPRFKSGTFDWYGQIQQLLPVIAEEHKARLIDLNEPLHSRPDLFHDDLHPDKEGAKMIAQTVCEKVTGNYGGLKLPRVFGNHMVLQREKPINIYGTANVNEEVEAYFGQDRATTETDENGHWSITFAAKAAGGPYQLQVRSKGRSIVLDDVLIGDVWLCSGQSNMDFPLHAAQGGHELAQQADSQQSLRLYHLKAIKPTYEEAWDVKTLKKTNELAYFDGSWEKANEKSAHDFSAIAYVFGKELRKKTGVPIGLIQVAVGGSGLESWLDRHSLESDPLLVDMLSNWRKSDFIMEWNRGRADVNLKLATNPKQRHPFEPAYNFEAGLAPLKNFDIRGVLWYQGESNVHNPELYTRLFKTFVGSLRQFFKQDTLAFYYVQLSSIDRPAWPYFRDTQRRLQKEVANTWMAVSSDLGDSLNVHPTNKIPIGQRLASLALEHSYGEAIAADAPEISSVKHEGDKLKLYFTASLKTSDNEPLVGFEWVDIKGNTMKVNAKLWQNTVSINLPKGAKIKAICYAWQSFTRANLESEEGIPVSTFYKNLTE